MSMTVEDLETLRAAKAILEHPGLIAKVTNALGKPLDLGLGLLPASWTQMISEATRKSLDLALNLALRTLDRSARPTSQDFLHRAAVTLTGATGGAFGLPALAVELPLSTAIMLRSIADRARSEGEDLSTPAAQLACLEVFALGGRSPGEDASESGYFLVRAALARAVSEATEFLAERGALKEGAPVIVRLVAQLSERFGIVVSEKAAAQAVPAVGAIGGALINLLFISHFQDMACGHFAIRRLERTYGPDFVKAEYLRLSV